jgi:hypothetical protein
MKRPESSKVRDILKRLSTIQSMERGKLTEFHRTHRATDGSGTVRLGPYHKLQAWENGRNHTRHIPVSEVPDLKRDLANYKEFKELVGTLEHTIIADTRARKSGTGGPTTAARDAKKNSANKRVSKSTAKPKTSSPKPKSS